MNSFKKQSQKIANYPFILFHVNPDYPAGGGNRTKLTYGNDDYVEYFYDEFDRLSQKRYNDTGRVLQYFYSADGSLAKVTYGDENSTSSQTKYLFEYDNSGRIVRSTQMEGDTLQLRTEHTYDEFDRLYSQRWFLDGRPHMEQYWYDDGEDGDGSLTQFRASTGQYLYYTYDMLKRPELTTVKNSAGEELFKTAYAYTYLGGNRTSNQLEYCNLKDSSGEVRLGFKYVYDVLGNIIEIRKSTGEHNLLYAYTYDDQNQLVEEKHYDGTGDGDSHITAHYVYTYDTAGNIRSESKTVPAPTDNDANATTTTTKSFTYSTGDWKDLLTAVNGSPIVYEGQTYENGTVTGAATSGNPVRYTNGSKTYTNLTWQQGRQLASLNIGNKTYTYDYDADGIRTEKVVDGVVHTYLTLNGKVVRESFPYAGSTVIMQFIYDASGRPFGLLYSTNGGASFATYHYATNAQGDILGIFFTRKDEEKQEVHWMGHYTYDAWGNIISIIAPNGTTPTNPAHLMNRNPLRYRGYYYDVETGFYYVSSRYYDPENGRFINADRYTSTGQGLLGYNMFAYCLNNPVRRKDVSGATSEDIFDGDGNPATNDDERLNGKSSPTGGNYNGSNGGVKIYRYGYDSAKKLVPSENDAKEESGLSFSTRAKPGSAVTTIEQINSTGKLYAVQDGRYHVSVYPIGGTISQWHNRGSNSPWTMALESVVIKN